MSVAAPKISEQGSTTPDIIQEEDFASLVFSETSKGGEYEVSGPTVVDSEAKVKKASFESADGSTLDLTFEQGTFKKTEISGSDEADTVVFKKGTVIKGKTTLNLGDGANVIKIKGDLKGKIVVEDFNEDSFIKYDGKKYGIDDIAEAKEEGIIIKIED